MLREAVRKLMAGETLTFTAGATKVEVSIAKPDRFDKVFDKLWNSILDKLEKLA